MLQKLRWNKQQ